MVGHGSWVHRLSGHVVPSCYSSSKLDESSKSHVSLHETDETTEGNVSSSLWWEPRPAGTKAERKTTALSRFAREKIEFLYSDQGERGKS